jgi:hypothetical protein
MLVMGRVREFLCDRQALQNAAAKASFNADARALEGLFATALSIADALATDPLRFRSIVHRVDLSDDRVNISINLLPIHSHTGYRSETATSPDAAQMPSHLLSVPIVKLRRGSEVRLVIAEPESNEDTLVDPAVIRLLATARAANAAMHASKDMSVAEVAKAHGFTNNYFTLLLRLATLAPSIVQAIIEGRQPPSLTRQRLAKITNLPLDWNEQRRMLGFA